MHITDFLSENISGTSLLTSPLVWKKYGIHIADGNNGNEEITLAEAVRRYMEDQLGLKVAFEGSGKLVAPGEGADKGEVLITDVSLVGTRASGIVLIRQVRRRAGRHDPIIVITALNAKKVLAGTAMEFFTSEAVEPEK